MSAGSAWKGRISLSYPGVGSAVFFTLFPENENARGSAICIYRDFLPEDAIVTHIFTFEGRDHIVNMKSGRKSLVIVTVHSEPELPLRRLCKKCVASLHIGLSIPTLRASTNDLISVNQKEGSMCGTRPSPTVTRERPPCFIPFFRMSSRLLNLNTQRGTPQPLGSYALCQGLIVFFVKSTYG